MERKHTAQEKYHKEKTVSFNMRIMKNTESDIIEKLESVPNKAGYIKTLIRQDIANGDSFQAAEKLQRIKRIIEE